MEISDLEECVQGHLVVKPVDHETVFLDGLATETAERVEGIAHDDVTATKSADTEIDVVTHDVDTIDVLQCVLTGHTEVVHLDAEGNYQELAITAGRVHNSFAWSKGGQVQLLTDLDCQFSRSEDF